MRQGLDRRASAVELVRRQTRPTPFKKAAQKHGQLLHRLSFDGTVQRFEVAAAYLTLFAGRSGLACESPSMTKMMIETARKDTP